MKSEAIAKLIGTLDGQLKSLPSVAQDMIHQYVVTNYVFSAVWALLFVGMAIALVCVFKHTNANIAKEGHWSSWDNHFAAWCFCMAGSISELMFLGLSLVCLWDALNPIASIISSAS